MTDTNTSPTEVPKNKNNCFLWGCLAVIILFFVAVCCLASLILLPIFTDFDPLGFDFRNRIEQYIPWQEFLDDPSLVPGLPDILDENFDPFIEDQPDDLTGSGPASGAEDISLSRYVASDFSAVFDYPTGWEIETEEYGVTFYDTGSYTYLYVGEDLVDAGLTAQKVAEDVMDSMLEEAQEGTFNVFESSYYTVPTGDDAYLISYEFTDSEGYYQWALDLEIVAGESNIFFYLSGEDPTDYQLYRELLDIIAASFSR